MTKTIKITISFILLLLAFFAGVSYSDSVKESAGWLFEGRGDEVELPDLSVEEGAAGEIEAPLDISTQAPVEEGGIETNAIEAPTK